MKSRSCARFSQSFQLDSPKKTVRFKIKVVREREKERERENRKNGRWFQDGELSTEVPDLVGS